MTSGKLISLLLIISVLFSCKPSAKSAGEYNDKIVALSNQIQRAENDLINSYKNGDAKLMEPALENFRNVIRTCTDSVNRMEKFDGKDDFKKAVLDMFTVYRSVSETEYKEMLEIFKEPDEAFTIARRNRVLELDSIINAKEKAGMQELKAFHKKFSDEYRVVITNAGEQKEKTPQNQ